MKIRLANKAIGRICGNCAHTCPTAYEKMVACEHPRVAKPNQNQMNWYRKNKGGCVFWKEKEVRNED